MTEKLRLWTRELADVMVEKLNADAKLRKLAGSLNDSIQLRCTDSPDGEDICATYRLQDRRIELLEWDAAPAPYGKMRNDPLNKKRILARTTAPYDIWVRLDTGEFGVIDAIVSPHYKFEGAKLKIMRNIRFFMRMNEIVKEMPKAY